MNYGELIQQIKKLDQDTGKIYIYGAGMRAKEVFYFMDRHHINVDGFVVTHLEDEKMLLGYPVCQVDTVWNKNIGIVLGMADIYAEEVKLYLERNSFDMKYVVDGGHFFSKDRANNEVSSKASLEITTVVGCSVNCRYCPQSVLQKKYFERDRNRERVMTVDTFRKVLEHSPQECNILFCGMSEPFLNPKCLDMISMACESGRPVRLYTTLMGASQEDIKAIQQLPIQFVALHVADEKGYAHIKTDEQYYRNIEQLMHARKKNGTPFVDNFSAQAQPVPRIAETLEKSGNELLISLHDRGGNLEGEDVSKRENYLVEERFECCFSGAKLNTNVVLPDGTVVLCNSDYGMQHVLGNLAEETYEAIREGEEMKRVYRGMAGDQSVDLLCRKCLQAIVKNQTKRNPPPEKYDWIIFVGACLQLLRINSPFRTKVHDFDLMYLLRRREMRNAA